MVEVVQEVLGQCQQQSTQQQMYIHNLLIIFGEIKKNTKLKISVHDIIYSTWFDYY